MWRLAELTPASAGENDQFDGQTPPPHRPDTELGIFASLCPGSASCLFMGHQMC